MQSSNMIFSVLVLCTQVNMNTNTKKIILLDCTDIEGTRISSEISHTRTDQTA
jgi:hypothetical protein